MLVEAYSEGSATTLAAARAAAPERPCGLPGGVLFARLGFPGRIWAHILCLFVEGFVLLASVRGLLSTLVVALIVLIERSDLLRRSASRHGGE